MGISNNVRLLAISAVLAIGLAPAVFAQSGGTGAGAGGSALSNSGSIGAGGAGGSDSSGVGLNGTGSGSVNANMGAGKSGSSSSDINRSENLSSAPSGCANSSSTGMNSGTAKDNADVNGTTGSGSHC